jgi:hypothetical protein
VYKACRYSNFEEAMTMIRFMMMVAIGVFFMMQLVHAQTFQKHFKEWQVYTAKEGGKKVCYMLSFPTNKSGNYNKRGEPYFIIKHVRSGHDEISVSSGYPYKKDSEVDVQIDGKNYALFTEDELAWAYDAKQDKAMVNAMKKGVEMRVKGISRKGTYSLDRYSLFGLTRAYNHMKGLCE